MCVFVTRDTYTQCRASRSELKVLVCEHDCCNRSMHETVLGSLDGYIIVFFVVAETCVMVYVVQS